jgi:replicative DNA helicase
MQTQSDRVTDLTGVSTGFPMLDDMTAGLQARDLVLIAGRPSMGKSLLAMQLAYTAAKAGHTAHIVTLEMSAAQCVLRLIAAESEVLFDHVRDAKRLHDSEWPKVVSAGAKVGALPLFFDEDVYDLRSIVARIRQVHMQSGTRIVVVDYLQLIRGPKAERHDLLIAEITREFKLLAKALGITIILLSQLNRDVELRADKRPGMADLRDSGSIEQDADVVLMIYRDGYYNPESPNKDFAEVLIRKQRQGQTGTVPLHTRFSIQRFDSAPEGLPAPVSKRKDSSVDFAG